MKLNLTHNKRLHYLFEEITNQNKAKSNPPPVFQENAKQLLMEYTEELTQSILDSAMLLAENRGSKVIEESDIALLLGE
jgi:histone H3/H4